MVKNQQKNIFAAGGSFAGDSDRWSRYAGTFWKDDDSGTELDDNKLWLVFCTGDNFSGGRYHLGLLQQIWFHKIRRR